MIIDLPYPPTVNTYWRNVGGRTLLSKAGRDYRRLAVDSCLAWKVVNKTPGNAPCGGPLDVEIVAYPPDRRKRDLDNLPKGVLDALQHAGMIHDDSQINRLTISRGPIRRGGWMTVEIQPMETEQ